MENIELTRKELYDLFWSTPLFKLSTLNSKLMFYHFTNTSSDNKVVYPKVKKSQLL